MLLEFLDSLQACGLPTLCLCWLAHCNVYWHITVTCSSLEQCEIIHRTANKQKQRPAHIKDSSIDPEECRFYLLGYNLSCNYLWFRWLMHSWTLFNFRRNRNFTKGRFRKGKETMLPFLILHIVCYWVQDIYIGALLQQTLRQTDCKHPREMNKSIFYSNYCEQQ